MPPHVYVVSVRNIPIGVFPTREIALESLRLSTDEIPEVLQESEDHTRLLYGYGEICIQCVITSKKAEPMWSEHETCVSCGKARKKATA